MRKLVMDGAGLQRACALALATVALGVWTGCSVPQPRGDGRLERIVEPTTKRGYWLYLPKQYVEASDVARRVRTWPTVVSFHGMKPFDSAVAQAKEWEYEADRYGFVVIAPELVAPDLLFGQTPLRTVHPGFKRDEEATLAILDHVFRTTEADPTQVLATSWSSGGYHAHYMVNQHPERFSAIGVRQSNFSAAVMSEELARRSRYHPILIVNTQNDFKICKEESREAVEWYERNGFENVAWVYIKGLGHERTPDLASDFFGRLTGIEPETPNRVLARRQAIDGNAEGLSFLRGGSAGGDARRPSRTVPSYAAQNRAGRSSRPATAQARSRSTPPERLPVNIRVSSSIDVQPLNLGFSAVAPHHWYDTAEFRWTLNGEPIASGINGQKQLMQPGEHTLGLEVIGPNQERYEVSRTIRVLPQLQSAADDREGRVSRTNP